MNFISVPRFNSIQFPASFYTRQHSKQLIKFPSRFFRGNRGKKNSEALPLDVRSFTRRIFEHVHSARDPKVPPTDRAIDRYWKRTIEVLKTADPWKLRNSPSRATRYGIGKEWTKYGIDAINGTPGKRDVDWKQKLPHVPLTSAAWINLLINRGFLCNFVFLKAKRKKWKQRV